MKWQKSTRFALYACMEMARAGDRLVALPAIAAKYRISAHHLAKVMSALAKAGLAEAVRGVGGGYRLARRPRDVTLHEIVSVFEAHAELDEGLGDAGGERLQRVFDEIEEQASFTLKSIRLSTLVG